MKNCESTLEGTSDDEIWKDSFDRLLNKRSLLRELKVIKNNVRLSFNNDSSVESSNHSIIKQVKLEEGKKKRNEISKASGSISTPIFNNTMYGPFDCPLSPISSWRLTHFNERNAWESSGTEKPYTSPEIATTSEECFLANQSAFNNIPILQVNGDAEPYHQSFLSITNTNNLPISGFAADVDNVSVILPPGKWRRSLTVWKRLNQLKYEDNSNPDFGRYSTGIQIQKKTSILKQRSNNHLKIARESERELLKICKQANVLDFSTIYSDIALRKCRKIGEGAYGEVYLNSTKAEETVLKIIPIEGNIHINGEIQKSYEQILSEVVITTELSNLRQSGSFRTSGFVFLKNVRCLKGKYPDHLIEMWQLYEQNYGSENDHPAIFKSDQLYVALEISYGGKELEGFIFRNSEQSYAAFLQITLSLAVAEMYLQFEHRDLHCGNILILPTDDRNVEYIVNNKKKLISTSGVKVTIIDYTLSRMLSNNSCYYNDLSGDDELFCAKGDYQYDIYRLMRKQLRNDWKTYNPYTNVLWLHYILHKLIKDVKYKNCRSKQHKLFIDRMQKIHGSILSYDSAFEFANKICD